MEKSVKNLLKTAKENTPEVSPYLAYRVLAKVRENRGRRRQWFFGGLSALLGSMVTAAILLVFNPVGQNEIFSAQLDKPYVVRLEVANLKTVEISEAEIILAQGMMFHSDEYSELKEQRSLVFQWPRNYKESVFPFVIKGEIEGIKPVRVRFFNGEGRLVEEREVLIRFEKSVS